MSGIDERLFGGDIHPEIKSKLVLRQELGRNPDFGEALNNVRENYSDIDLFPYRRGELARETELSSRTPVARMWTALDILKEGKWKPSRDFPNKETAVPSKKRQKEDWERYRAIYRQKPDGKVEYKIIESLGKKVYVVGNNELNTLQPNESVSEKRVGKTGLRLSEVFPDEQQTVSEIDGNIESQNNQFLKPTAGVTGVSSETAGPGGLGAVEKTTVNFIVHNFHDFDKIYSKYFMRPGAQIFVDIGWDTVPFYDPNNIIKLTEKGENVRDILFDKKKGIVNKYLGDIKIFMGYVVSWDAKARADGGFDCSIDISSQGSALLSYNHSKKQEKRNKLLSSLDETILSTTDSYFDIFARFPELKEKYPTVKDLFNSDDNISNVINLLRDSLRSSIFNFPTGLALQTGVYWHVDSGKSDIMDTNSMYMSYGLFEDEVLNASLGFFSEGDNVNGIWDSYNSVVTYDRNLARRQFFEKDSSITEKFKFLYPYDWGKTAHGYISDNDDYGTEKVDTGGDGTYSSNSSKKENAKNYPQIPGIDENKNIFVQHFSLGIIPLRELFISVGMIKRLLKSSNNINDFMSKLLQEINDNSENIFDLRVASATDSADRCCVIDNNCLVGEKLDEEVTVSETFSTQKQNFVDSLFMFKPDSPNTIIKGYDLSMATPSDDLQSMLAIQSGISGYSAYPLDSALETDTALKNLNITDENIAYIPNYGLKLIENEAKQESALENQTEKNNKVAGFDNSFNMSIVGYDDFGRSSDNISKVSDDSSTVSMLDMDLDEETMRDTVSNKNPIGHNSNAYRPQNDPKKIELPKPVEETNVTTSPFHYWSKLARGQFSQSKLSITLPINLSLQIYGISGLIVGNQVKIDSLPERYRDRVYFQIAKISHNVSNAAWTTSLEFTMRYLVRSNKYREDFNISVRDYVVGRKWLDKLQLKNWSWYAKYVKSIRPISEGTQQYLGIDYQLRFTAAKSSFDVISIEDTMPWSHDILHHATDTTSWIKEFYQGDIEKRSNIEVKFDEGKNYTLIVLLGKYWIVIPDEKLTYERQIDELGKFLLWNKNQESRPILTLDGNKAEDRRVEAWHGGFWNNTKKLGSDLLGWLHSRNQKQLDRVNAL